MINVDFVRTEDQLCDIFTKSLSQVKFEELRIWSSANKVDRVQE
jgi:hypothetical protein